MKTNYLFPHKWKTISGILFFLSLAFLTAIFCFEVHPFDLEAPVFTIIGQQGVGDSVYFNIIKNDILDELLMIVAIPSGLIYAFSKEKKEDEMVASIRLHSLVWATIVNYGIVLLSYIFVYGIPFLSVMMVALLSQLLIFIAVFRYKMYRFYNTRQDEE